MSTYFYFSSRFIAGIIGYIVIGAIIMKVHFNKNGLDIVPQKMFWFVVPGLIMVRYGHELNVIEVK